MFSRLWQICSLGLLIAAPVLAAQPETEAQFLYRSGNSLYMVDALSQEKMQLSGVETDNHDEWVWSPNGQYLLRINNFVRDRRLAICTYDPANIRCSTDFSLNTLFAYAAWSPDSSYLSYANSEAQKGQLWIYDLTAASSHLLYQEPDENVGPYNEKRLIEQSWWSPSGRRILFLDYYSILGGTLNCLNLINSGGGDPITLYCAKSASYDPLWSPGGEWLLLDLEQQYSSPPDDGEYGDVFLFNAENGIRYQLTNTSAVAEGNLRWALAGEQIQFAADENEITINMADIIGLPDDSLPSNVPATVEPLILEREPLGIVEYLSSDGKYVAYIVAEDDWKLYLAHADGTDAAFIDTVNSTIDFLGWRP